MKQLRYYVFRVELLQNACLNSPTKNPHACYVEIARHSFPKACLIIETLPDGSERWQGCMIRMAENHSFQEMRVPDVYRVALDLIFLRDRTAKLFKEDWFIVRNWLEWNRMNLSIKERADKFYEKYKFQTCSEKLWCSRNKIVAAELGMDICGEDAWTKYEQRLARKRRSADRLEGRIKRKNFCARLKFLRLPYSERQRLELQYTGCT